MQNYKGASGFDDACVNFGIQYPHLYPTLTLAWLSWQHRFTFNDLLDKAIGYHYTCADYPESDLADDIANDLLTKAYVIPQETLNIYEGVKEVEYAYSMAYQIQQSILNVHDKYLSDLLDTYIPQNITDDYVYAQTTCNRFAFIVGFVKREIF